MDKRFFESIASLYKNSAKGHLATLALSGTDTGVTRNLGRLGARFAPKSLLYSLGRMSIPQNLKKEKIEVHNVADVGLELEDFELAQKHESSLLNKIFKNNTGTFIHIGGGHDHIFPLGMALNQKKLVILNIDAHADTRTEDYHHSGNPFRLLDLQCKIKLFEFGLERFSNTESTLSPLKNSKIEIAWRGEASTPNMLNLIENELKNDCHFIFSLDCDAINLSHVKAVSAPNPRGLDIKEVSELISYYKNSCKKNNQREIYGIYEFNPLYDDVSFSSARVISSLIFEMLLEQK